MINFHCLVLIAYAYAQIMGHLRTFHKKNGAFKNFPQLSIPLFKRTMTLHKLRGSEDRKVQKLDENLKLKAVATEK